VIYMSLLRGINVGGRNKVEMARLKKLFESIGFGEVRTYINSGNVIFVDDVTRRTCGQRSRRRSSTSSASV